MKRLQMPTKPVYEKFYVYTRKKIYAFKITAKNLLYEKHKEIM